VISSIEKNKNRHKKLLRSYKEGGEMYAYSFHDNKSMINRLMKDITEDMQNNMNVVILCRTNFDGMIPAFTLEQQHKFDFSISGENMTLNSALPRSIFRCASLFTERSTNAVKSTLELLAGRNSAWTIKELVYTMQNDKSSIFTMDFDDIKYSVPQLADLIGVLRHYRENNSDMEGLKYLYSYMLTEVYAGDNSYCENARAYIEVLLHIIDTNRFDTVFDFCDKVQEYSDNLQLRVNKPKVPIQIATVHEYKGKERDSVYIWNDSMGVFPASKADMKEQEEMEEERRVHYIAWTRAKKKLTVYTKKDNRGIFLNETTVEVVSGESIGGSLSSSGVKKPIDMTDEEYMALAGIEFEESVAAMSDEEVVEMVLGKKQPAKAKPEPQDMPELSVV
jgi:DNA helicase-2/ATP-dependent DNA helicase PcrA